MVDPSDSKKIHQYLSSNSGKIVFDQKKLSTILTTHKHWDHAGGNLYFVKHAAEFSSPNSDGLQVFGHEECEGVNHVLLKKDDLETFTIFDDETLVQAYHTPCHTNGHVCYVIKSDGELDCLFCGDTFFVGGCGKFFEGTAQQMFDNIVKLNKEIGKNAMRMLLCCGHEYTVKNMQFIVDKISDTETTRKYLNKYKSLIENGQDSGSSTLFHGTIPSTWQDEMEYNPYFKAALLDSFEDRKEFFGKMIKDGSTTEENLKSWTSVKLLQTVRDLKDKY